MHLVEAQTNQRRTLNCRTANGRTDLLDRPEYVDNAARVAVRPQLLTELGAILAGQRSEDLAPRLEAAGVPYAPIARPEQLVEDPHLKQSGALVPMTTEDGGTTDVVLLPLTMGGRRPGVRMPLPKVGEHTEEVLASLKRRASCP